MEHYSEEYNFENLVQVNVLNEICSNLYFAFISIKYKNKFNYLEKILNSEYEKAKKETTEILSSKFSEDDFTTTKLNLSILNSLYFHYYRISYNEGKLSFNARKKWIINTLISDIDRQKSYYLKYNFILEFKKNLTKTLVYLELISNHNIYKSNPDIIKEKTKWSELIRNLKNDNILNEENHWINLGSEYSKPKTQIAILIFILRENNYFNTTNQKLINNVICGFFEESFSDSYYTEIKGILGDENGIESTNQHFKTYTKLKSYL